MQGIQYFKSSWGDIKNSPGWFGKLCLLALISFIPVFGAIVALGYVYGWAREIAWGTHEPMPARIFSNEDGKLYRRGWFILVLTFVAALVPYIVMQIGGTMQGIGAVGTVQSSYAVGSGVMVLLGALVSLIGFVGAILLGVLAWIGSMRISIYDRLSAGFQFGKIWKMLRHDASGILRIFGMNLLFGFIIGFILMVVYFVFVFAVVFAGLAGLAAAGYDIGSIQYMSDSQATALLVQLIASAGVVGFIGLLIFIFVAYMGEAFITLLTARALGYWTMQFNVAQWRGQDDPMPFELVSAAGAAPVGQASYYAAGQTARYQAAQQGQPGVQQPYQPQPQPQYQPQSYQAYQPQQQYQPQQLYQQPPAEQAPPVQVNGQLAQMADSAADSPEKPME